MLNPHQHVWSPFAEHLFHDFLNCYNPFTAGPILNARSLWTLNVLCSRLFNSAWSWCSTSTAREAEIFKLLSSESCRVCDTDGLGGGGHVLCRSLRKTCSLVDADGDGVLYCPIFQNTASHMRLSLWCFHVTAWGRGLFQVNKTMPSNKIPSSYFLADIRHSAELCPHSGSG